MSILFRNARLVFSPGQGVLPGALLVEDGVIQSFVSSGDEDRITGVDRSIDCRGDYLAPGLIDLHCHGAVGRDAMEATSEAFKEILSYHASNGTTTAVLTTVAASLPEMLAVLGCAEQYRDEALGFLFAGIHLEGPYFSPLRRGAHRAEMLRLPSEGETAALLDHAGTIRRMTLAPELPGSLELIRMLSQKGISVSAGHSDALEEEALAGFAAGITQVTHLHNAMSSIRKTAPDSRRGLAEAALEAQGILCELIADGIHVSPELLREAWMSKGWEQVALVSDATAGAGLGEGGSFHLGTLPCRVEGRAAWSDQVSGRCLAGSTSVLFDGIKTMVTQVGVPIEEAVAMASLVPARSLGLEGKLGSIAPGKIANLLRFSNQWEIRDVWIKGKKF
jgi:N-acetylglucosamine-6-phosphate deacetylase